MTSDLAFGNWIISPWAVDIIWRRRTTQMGVVDFEWNHLSLVKWCNEIDRIGMSTWSGIDFVWLFLCDSSTVLLLWRVQSHWKNTEKESILNLQESFPQIKPWTNWCLSTTLLSTIWGCKHYRIEVFKRDVRVLKSSFYTQIVCNSTKSLLFRHLCSSTPKKVTALKHCRVIWVKIVSWHSKTKQRRYVVWCYTCTKSSAVETVQ